MTGEGHGKPGLYLGRLRRSSCPGARRKAPRGRGLTCHAPFPFPCPHRLAFTRDGRAVVGDCRDGFRTVMCGSRSMIVNPQLAADQLGGEQGLDDAGDLVGRLARRAAPVARRR